MSKRIRNLLSALRDIDPLDAVPRLTLLVLVGHIFRQEGTLGVLDLTLAMCGLFYAPWSRSPWFWGLLVALVTGHIYKDTYYLDNHFYLAGYWCLVLALTFLNTGQDRLRVLRFNGKALIGLCMLLAVVWKVISPDYVNGSFFHFTLLTDTRFFDFARLTRGLTAEMVQHNYMQLAQAIHPLADPAQATIDFIDAPRLRTVALVLTWWTVIIEGVLAVLFLLPSTRVLAHLRSGTLIFFAITVYPIAPVVGFGSLLLTMGYAQCDEQMKSWRLWYLGAILFVQLTKIPVLSWI